MNHFEILRIGIITDPSYNQKITILCTFLTLMTVGEAVKEYYNYKKYEKLYRNGA